MLFGQPLDAGDINARRRVGYMSQSFSLYTELTVRQNLELHARLFHSAAAQGQRRVSPSWSSSFGLDDYLDQQASELPLGIRQRLSLAVAVVHEPELLILDEPTSGVDPLARDDFWELLIDLSRNQGVTIFVSTHFMNEAERCDRVSLMDSGRVLATDTPAKSHQGARRRHPGRRLHQLPGSGRRARPLPKAKQTPVPARDGRRTGRSSAGATAARLQLAAARSPTPSAKRSSSCAIPIRLGFALFGTAFLMVVFGFGISTDVNNLTFAVLDHDQSHESRAYLEELRGSAYFTEQPPLADYADLEQRLKSGEIKAAIEIPPGFGRDSERGRPVWVGAWVDGAMPYRAQKPSAAIWKPCTSSI